MGLLIPFGYLAVWGARTLFPVTSRRAVTRQVRADFAYALPHLETLRLGQFSYYRTRLSFGFDGEMGASQINPAESHHRNWSYLRDNADWHTLPWLPPEEIAAIDFLFFSPYLQRSFVLLSYDDGAFVASADRSWVGVSVVYAYANYRPWRSTIRLDEDLPSGYRLIVYHDSITVFFRRFWGAIGLIFTLLGATMFINGIFVFRRLIKNNHQLTLTNPPPE
ncbi:MAG: hypothetical protein FWC71_11470 [Defluviitaleaceae bacterium]|nr:hypothetical protein [Defluviitaleaceae bacterium]